MSASHTLLFGEESKILVVRQLPRCFNGLRSYLKTARITLETARDEETALEALRRSPENFYTVFLDPHHGGEQGLKLLAQIKEDPLLKLIPVILLTENAIEEELRKGVQAGARSYLTRQDSLDVLISVLTVAILDYSIYREIRRRSQRTLHSMRLVESGQFYCSTLEDARNLAALLSHASPAAEGAVYGLEELIVNALEHGNLGITYDEKTHLVEADRWEKEILRRSLLPANQHKQVSVRLTQTPEAIQYLIEDEGEGFDWRKFLDFDPERMFDNHGRGILLARMHSFDLLEYQGSGNKVLATIFHQHK